MTPTRNRVLALSALAAALALAGSPAQAQSTLYPGKFVCGFQQGNVPLLADPAPLPPSGSTPEEIIASYEDFKPGNYATKINVLGLEMDTALDQVDVLASVPGRGVFPVASPSVPLGQTAMIGCPQIVAALIAAGVPVDGSLIEGFALVIGPTPNFVVEGIYTFESQNGFERHQVYRDTGQANLIQQYGTLLQTLGGIFSVPLNVFTGPLGTSPPLAPLTTASGAGGLGLGASIDVERFDPVPIVSSPPVFSPDTEPSENDDPLQRLLDSLR